MSARSSRRDGVGLALVALVAGCGKHAPAAPTADPAQVKAAAARMMNQVPAPGAVRDCAAADYAGVPTLTGLTLAQLAGTKIPDDPEHARWINPAELDAPAARTLASGKADARAAGEAAAVLLAAPAWVVYHVDHVNAPMALGVKDPKIGTIGTRVIKFDRTTGAPTCALVFFFQNDPATSQLAIDKSDRAAIDPEIAKALREDLAQQYVKLAPPRVAATPAVPTTK